MPRALRSGALVALAVTGGAGCELLDRCTVESRSLEFEARAPADSRGAVAFLELSQTRGVESRDWILWHVRVGPGGPVARMVALREGSPGAPGRVLYRFPLLNAVPPSGVITQVFSRTEYAGQIPFRELWDLVRERPVSIEIALDGNEPPLRVGPLVRTSFSDWQETCI